MSKMPSWLTPLLLWGGIALVIVFAAALAWVENFAPPDGSDAIASAAPTELYWVLLVIGVVAAIAGFYLARNK
jgi:hypothetical protein